MLALTFGVAALVMLVLAVKAFLSYYKNEGDGWFVLLPSIGFCLFGLAAYFEIPPTARQIALPAMWALAALLVAYAYFGNHYVARRSTTTGLATIEPEGAE